MGRVFPLITALLVLSGCSDGDGEPAPSADDASSGADTSVADVTSADSTSPADAADDTASPADAADDTTSPADTTPTSVADSVAPGDSMTASDVGGQSDAGTVDVGSGSDAGDDTATDAGIDACVRKECITEGWACGTWPDGCGGQRICPDCIAPETCGGGGDLKKCGCREDVTTLCARIAKCGKLTATNACGATVDVDCGDTCNPGDACGVNSANECGRILDVRDGQKYGVSQIGSQIWMYTNLNYYVAGSVCKNDVPNVDGKCDSLEGRYYGWSVAMQGGAASNAIPSGVQGVCPAGWHLPSRAEFEILLATACVGFESACAPRLKSSTPALGRAWKPYTGIYMNDNAGFGLMPAGRTWGGGGGASHEYLEAAYLWTATSTEVGMAHMISASYTSNAMSQTDNLAASLQSVRCLKN